MRLHLKMRPVVAFDPSNKDHRRDYAEFLRTGSWGHCAVRYELDESCGELQSRIQRNLLEYYLGKEFRLDMQNPDNRSNVFAREIKNILE